MIKGEIRSLEILEVIHENPGLNFRDMMRITGLKNGSISHHIKKLEKRKKVNVKRRSRNTRFFPLNVNERESILLEMLRRPTLNKIILLLLKHSRGLTLNQIENYVPKAQSTISLCLQILLSKKIIIFHFHDSKKFFMLKNINEIQNTKQKYNIKPIRKTIQNFNEMFESL